MTIRRGRALELPTVPTHRISGNRHHHARSVRSSRTQALVPGFQVAHVRSFDVKAKPAVDRRPHRYVCHGERRSYNVISTGQVRVEYSQVLSRLTYSRRYRRSISILRWRADKSDKRRAEIGPERTHLPVHPPVRVGPPCEVLRAQRAHPMPGGEVPHDGVGLPEHEIAIRDRRHQAVGVQPEVTWLPVAAERATDVDALYRELPALRSTTAPSGRLWSCFYPRSGAHATTCAALTLPSSGSAAT